MVSALMLILSVVALIKSANSSSDPNCTFSNGSSLTQVPFYVCHNHFSLPQNLALAGEVHLLEMSEHFNILQTLKNGDLVNTGMHNLTKLYLNHCGIEKIELGAFKGGEKLLLLSLNFNRIEVLDLEVFKDLPGLELLGLEGNPLKRFGNQEFPRMNLIELHLGSCALTEVKEGLLQNLQKLRKLRLQTNQLKTLEWKVFQKSLSVVLLQDNPWHCDCKIKFLLDYLDSNLVTWKTPEIIPECSSAVEADLVGVNWAEINRSILSCPIAVEMSTDSDGLVLPSTTPFDIQSKKKHFWDMLAIKVLMGIVLAFVVLSGFYLLNRVINKLFPEKTYNEVSKEEEGVNHIENGNHTTSEPT